jgi:putative ABC transport system permease protein
MASRKGRAHVTPESRLAGFRQMQVPLIIAALRRHKSTTLLMMLQIALALAIVSNALFVIQQRTNRGMRPTGVHEANLLTIQNVWVNADTERVGPLAQNDLFALRHIPGVVDATQMNAFPLLGNGWTEAVHLDPDPSPAKWITQGSVYAADEHTLSTLGIKLLAGRDFVSEEIVEGDQKSLTPPAVIIVTKALADKIYPNEVAIGKPIYLTISDDVKPSVIIGIVEKLTSPFSRASSFVETSILIPAHIAGKRGYYLVRSTEGQLAVVAKASPNALLAVSRMRILSNKGTIRTFAQVRADAYRDDTSLAIMMGIVSVVLLTITAGGIVGLNTFMIDRRRRYIGVRRALGARRLDILSFLLIENLIVSGGGVTIGALLGYLLDIALMRTFQMERMSSSYLFIGVALLLLLGQLSTLAPALRASQTSPTEAMRTV